jgi:large subunit ribosomal protein L1
MKKGKKYIEAANKVDKKKLYSVEEAMNLVKETAITKFDSSVEVAIRLNLDSKKADQQLRGTIVLPNGTGKTKKVLVVAKGDQAKAAKEGSYDCRNPIFG